MRQAQWAGGVVSREHLSRRFKRTGRRVWNRIQAGALKRRWFLPEELRNAPRLGLALQTIQQRWPLSEQERRDAERPVFIFSAGWRSGSTLLQRLIISSGEVGVWGEPLGETGMIAKLAHSLSVIGPDWPPDAFFPRQAELEPLAESWIANLTPEMAFLRQSHRAFFQQWLGSSVAQKFGAQRWGLKEVRLSGHYAEYLKWLFPNAVFLFIYRNVHDAYRSWKGNHWLNHWPGYYSHSPAVFARHWCFLLDGFLDTCDRLDGMMIKFEDLVGRRIDLGRLAQHAGVKHIDPNVLDRKIGSPRPGSPRQKKTLTLYERTVIKLLAGPTLKRCGYLS